jgi:gliding motility-associated-like protein
VYTQAGTFDVKLNVSYKDERCANSLTKSITIGEIPNIAIDVDGSQDLCEGESVVLSVSGDFESVEWNTDETTSSITVSESGTYLVKLTNAQGCESDTSVEITVHPNPVITITPSEISILEGESTVLTASGATNYEWLTGDNISDPYIENPTVSPLETMAYSVRGINDFNCFNTAEVLVTVLPFVEEVTIETPPLLSPNGDSNNDVWMIEDIREYPEYTVSIFNRSGMIIYETDQYYGNEWDGSFNGQEIVNGVYYYVISNEGTKIKTGTITVLR